MDSYTKATILITLIVVFQHCAFANRQSYGENCNEGQKCNSGAGLACDNGTCVCEKPDEMIFDIQRNYCVDEIYPPRTYNQPCSRSTPCADNLICKNGMCNCHFEQFYDNETLSCKSLSRGPCNNGSDCTPNSICVKKSVYNVCECTIGFTEDAYGKCQLGYGSFCDGNQVSDYPQYSRCRNESGLACINNVCSCSPIEMYDESDNTCKILAGAVCPKSEDIGTKSCVNNASCVYKVPYLRGSCTCLKGFVQSVNRTCNQIRNVVTRVTRVNRVTRGKKNLALETLQKIY